MTRPSGKRGHASSSALLPAISMALVVAAVACGRSGPDQSVRVAAAASMRGVMDDLAAIYARSHPGVRVLTETGGSTALARRVLELDADADLVVLADVALFAELLQPTWTGFHVGFASDRLVLAYTPSSRGRGRLDDEGWLAVVAGDDVRLAMADPDLAPAGYRTLQALRLLDLDSLAGGEVEATVRAKVGRRYMRRDVAELLAPLQAGAIDYAFMYAATARAAGLEILELPASANLGDLSRADSYARAEVEVAGRERGSIVLRRGAPVLYGASVRGSGNRAPEAMELLRLLLSADGREVLRSHGFEPVHPPVTGAAVPAGVLPEAAPSESP